MCLSRRFPSLPGFVVVFRKHANFTFCCTLFFLPGNTFLGEEGKMLRSPTAWQIFSRWCAFTKGTKAQKHASCSRKTHFLESTAQPSLASIDLLYYWTEETLADDTKRGDNIAIHRLWDVLIFLHSCTQTRPSAIWHKTTLDVITPDNPLANLVRWKIWQEIKSIISHAVNLSKIHGTKSHNVLLSSVARSKWPQVRHVRLRSIFCAIEKIVRLRSVFGFVCTCRQFYWGLLHDFNDNQI